MDINEMKKYLSDADRSLFEKLEKQAESKKRIHQIEQKITELNRQVKELCDIRDRLKRGEDVSYPDEIDKDFSSDDCKIGDFVQRYLRPILEQGKITDKEFSDMKDKEASKAVFGIHFPLLSTQIKDERGRPRYYAKPLTVKGEKLFLCSQWFPASEQRVKEWVKNHSKE